MIVKVYNVEEYLYTQRIFLIMGGWRNINRERTIHFPDKEFEKKFSYPEPFYSALYEDNEIYWFIGGALGKKGILYTFEEFKAKYNKLLRETKLKRILQ